MAPMPARVRYMPLDAPVPVQKGKGQVEGRRLAVIDHAMAFFNVHRM
jgi:hypothetical protein